VLLIVIVAVVHGKQTLLIQKVSKKEESLKKVLTFPFKFAVSV